MISRLYRPVETSGIIGEIPIPEEHDGVGADKICKGLPIFQVG